MLSKNALDFKKVFTIIKHHCGETTSFSHTDCFKTVAEGAGVPLEKIEVYLDLLQDFGLIKYSMTGKCIELTPFGKKLDIEIKE